MSKSGLHRLPRAARALQFFTLAFIASYITIFADYATKDNYGSAVATLLQGALIIPPLWVTATWLHTLSTRNASSLRRSTTLANRLWSWSTFAPALTGVILFLAQATGNQARPIPLLLLFLVTLASTLVYTPFTISVRLWLTDANNGFKGEHQGLSVRRTRTLRRWLTATQVFLVLYAFSGFSLLEMTSVPTPLDFALNFLAGAAGVIGFIAVHFVKDALTLIPTDQVRQGVRQDGAPFELLPPAPPTRSQKIWRGVGLTTIAALAALVIWEYWPERTSNPATQAYERGITPEGQHYYGNADAPVVVHEYADFQCPGCQEFANDLRADFLKDELRAGKVKVVFADFPLPFHANAEDAAVAARCAGEAGRFWEFHDVVFARQDDWANIIAPSRVFVSIVRELGIADDAWLECYISDAPRQFVQAGLDKAMSSGLPGTPSFTVNGEPVAWTGDNTVEGSLAGVHKAVRDALEHAEKGSSPSYH